MQSVTCRLEIGSRRKSDDTGQRVRVEIKNHVVRPSSVLRSRSGRRARPSIDAGQQRALDRTAVVSE
jgi:hypothetical protein